MRSAALLTACLAALALAACGSSDSSSSSSTAAANAPVAPALPAASGASQTPATATPTTAKPTKADKLAHKQFLKLADPICSDYNTSLKSIQGDLQKAGPKAKKSLKAYVPGLTDAQTAAKRAADRFHALKPPPGDVRGALLVGRVLDEQTKLANLLLQSAQGNDSTKFQAASAAVSQVRPQLQSVMQAFGMKKICGAGN